MIKTVIFASALLAASGAMAQDWTHAAAAMGQFEGGVRSADDTHGIDYSCNPNMSQIGFFADGVHVAAGESTISVDGTELVSGNTTYNSSWDATSFTNRVEARWGDKLIDEHNALVDALASGYEASWTTPSGETYTFDLTGSADIKSCLVD